MGRSYYTLSLDYEMHWHCEDNATLVYIVRTMQLWFTLWFSYYGGRKTSAIQLYLADLH